MTVLAAARPLDVLADFPAIPTGWAYLDTAATAQKPRPVIDAITRGYDTAYATVHRGVYARSAEMTLAFESARAQMTAAEKRARLAQESRGFFEKSFRLGETDLPTRLRIELEATDAKRQAALARLDQAAAISSLRQALGLLPE